MTTPFMTGYAPWNHDGVMTWAEVDLDAIAENVAHIQRFVGPEIELIAMLKANAYGHGLLPIARTVLEAGVARLATHRLREGVVLRQAGITAPILLTGQTLAETASTVIDYRLTPTVATLATAESLAMHATGPVNIHIKVDTGMSRFGIDAERAIDFVTEVARLPHLVLEGIYSHLASADAPDLASAWRQWQQFQEILSALEAHHIHIPCRHLCNSAGLLRLPQTHLTATRPGLLIYGMPPSADSLPPFPIRPALALKSTVIYTRDLPAGRSISYGGIYTTPAAARVALVSLGYGDGYPRLLSNRGAVLIHGQRAPIRGRICMDQMVVEVTHIPDVHIGDEVVAIGAQAGNQITAEEVAVWAETINYEITTGLLPQAMRLYHHQGQWRPTMFFD